MTKLALITLLLPGACLASNFLDVPVDQLTPDDPALMVGHDFKAMLAAAKRAGKKDDFETDAAFLSKVSNLPAYGKIRLSSSIAVPLGPATSSVTAPVRFSYDVTNQTIQICISEFGTDFFYDATGGPIKAFRVRLEARVSPEGTYLGSTAFNAKARVRKQTLRTTEVVLPAGHFRDNCTYVAALSTEDARAYLPKAKIIAIGKFTAPFAEDIISVSSPTYDNPIEERQLRSQGYLMATEYAIIAPGRVVYRTKAP